MICLCCEWCGGGGGGGGDSQMCFWFGDCSRTNLQLWVLCLVVGIIQALTHCWPHDKRRLVNKSKAIVHCVCPLYISCVPCSCSCSCPWARAQRVLVTMSESFCFATSTCRLVLGACNMIGYCTQHRILVFHTPCRFMKCPAEPLLTTWASICIGVCMSVRVCAAASFCLGLAYIHPVHPVPQVAIGILMIFYCCRLSGPLYSWQHIVPTFRPLDNRSPTTPSARPKA